MESVMADFEELTFLDKLEVWHEIKQRKIRAGFVLTDAERSHYEIVGCFLQAINRIRVLLAA